MKKCRELFEQMQSQPFLYNPGVFWQEASKDMLDDLEESGVDTFRQLPSSLMFFVPTYGHPGNSFSAENIRSLNEWGNKQALTSKQSSQLENFISGYSAAIADYRVLMASEYRSSGKPCLYEFSESQIGSPKEQFEIEGRRYSRSALNYLLGLSFLKKHVDFSSLENVLEIGGGFGTLGEIIFQLAPGIRYIDIDIPPTLCCSSYYLSSLAGDNNVSDFESLKGVDMIDIDALKPLNTLPSWDIEKLDGQVDLFVNFISFQEMEPDIVQNYLDHVARLKTRWVLLRNMREGKPLRSERRFGVDKPIFSDDYAKMLPEYELVEKNVMPFGFKTVDGFHSELMLFKRI